MYSLWREGSRRRGPCEEPSSSGGEKRSRRPKFPSQNFCGESQGRRSPTCLKNDEVFRSTMHCYLCILTSPDGGYCSATFLGRTLSYVTRCLLRDSAFCIVTENWSKIFDGCQYGVSTEHIIKASRLSWRPLKKEVARNVVLTDSQNWNERLLHYLKSWAQWCILSKIWSWRLPVKYELGECL